MEIQAPGARPGWLRRFAPLAALLCVSLVVALESARLARGLGREHDLLRVLARVRAVSAAPRIAAARRHGHAAQRDRRDRGRAPQAAGSGAWCLDFHSWYGIP